MSTTRFSKCGLLSINKFTGIYFEMNKYIKLIQASTPYATRMTRLRNRIFGDIVRPIDNKSKRVVEMFSVEPVYKSDEIVNHYPRLMETFHLMSKLRDYGLYRDEHRDFQDEMKRLRELRGKVKPKKGFGKQAVNKK